MVETAIYSKLSGASDVTDIVGTRIYPDRAPQDASYPFIILELTSSERIESKDAPNLRYEYITITCLGKKGGNSSTYISLQTLSEAVISTLEGLVEDVGDISIYESTLEGVNNSDVEGNEEIYEKQIDFKFFINK